MQKIDSIKELKLAANTVREDIIRMLVKAGSGHTAGSLGMADVLTALYFNVLEHDPSDPKWGKRDIFVLSNGHICPALYSVMARSGYFPVEEIMTLRKFGSRLQGHPHRQDLPGLETSSGPLGCGISQACGMALALKIDNRKNRVYCAISDGEMDEGNTWEGLMLAAKYGLDNLTVIVDRNNIQIGGFTDDVMPLEPLKEKISSFNWDVIEIDGNSMEEITRAFELSKKERKSPFCIIAKTIPGKGVSFAENRFEWHGVAPSEEEGEKALKELDKTRRSIEAGEDD